MSSLIEDLKRIAEVEFADIVKDSFFIGYKLRIVLNDSSFIDVRERTNWKRPSMHF
jgi:hypothetical protein